MLICFRFLALISWSIGSNWRVLWKSPNSRKTSQEVASSREGCLKQGERMAEAKPASSHQSENNQFKQQTLPAWQPILTAGTVLPIFFVIGVAFIPIGVGLMYLSDTVKEVSIEYTNCKMDGNANKMCKDVIINLDEGYSDGKRNPCNCTLKIKEEDIGEENWTDSVFIYYGLTNFYQNHRRYVRSRDDLQLYGDLYGEKNEYCSPFLIKSVEGEPDKRYAPCGAIANSLFNDTIVLEYCEKKPCLDTDTWKTVKVTGRGIAWESDKQYKFKNPGGENTVAAIRKAWEDNNAIKPMDWQKEVWELDETDPDNNGLQNEDLIVWMRTAALPNFRKLYRKVMYGKDGSFSQSEGLRADYSYRLKIGYNFEVSQFQGTKSVIISTTSILGGKNPFLGIAYIVVGCICFLMGIIFLFIHLKFGRTTQEMMNIDPRSQYNEN